MSLKHGKLLWFKKGRMADPCLNIEVKINYDVVRKY